MSLQFVIPPPPLSTQAHPRGGGGRGEGGILLFIIFISLCVPINFILIIALF